MKNGINEYHCNVCREGIRTIQRDDGTTPMMLACRATEGCKGSMMSAFYQVDQTLTPTHEWYKPAGKIRNRDMRQYVERGGLLIRPIVKN